MIATRGRSRPPQRTSFSLFIAAWMLALPAVAERPRASDAAAGVVSQAQWLEGRGQVDQAQELLQRVAESEPDNELIALGRAEAYLRADNPFWALKVLGEFLQRHPEACAARAMAARVHLREANLEQAAQMLDAHDCGVADETRLRFSLLRLELAELEGQRASVYGQLRLARDTNRRYEEDDQRLARLMRRYDPFHEPKLSWSVDVGGGFATAGLGSLPLDLPASRNPTTSGLVGADLALRWLPRPVARIQPVAEAELHLVQYLEPSTEALSTRQPLWRLGSEFGSGARRLLIGYAGDLVDLQGGGQYPSSAFAVGHRLEYRLRLDRVFAAYGSFGHRRFWERDRARFESEQGLSRSIALSEALNLVVGGSVRVYRAEARAYDQFGATAHAALGIAMPKGFALQESVALSYDLFPRSAGYFDAAPERRRDVVLRVGLGLRTPAIFGVRFGLDYGYVSRNSRADTYDFADHRALVSLSWASDSDRITVKTIPKAGRVPLPYPDTDVKDAPQKQLEVLDAIERDQSQRHNTSCMK